MTKMTKKRVTQIVFFFIVISFMLFFSEFLDEKEIIFPEVAALCVGCFLLDDMPWNTNYIRICFFIPLCAILGVCIVKFIPYSLQVQIMIAYFIAQIVYLFSKTTLAPMISAIVLPVLLQSASLVYIISSIVLVVFIIMFSNILDALGHTNAVDYTPCIYTKEDYMNAFCRCIVVTILAFVLIPLNVKFCIAPPLLVAFTELTRENNKVRKKLPKLVLLISLCALEGTVCRYIFVEYLHTFSFIGGIITIFLVVCTMDYLRIYSPPAAAMSILAFLIPSSVVFVYPLEVCLGISILAYIAKYFPIIKKRRID